MQTPETNDIALVHLKSPMQMTDYVQVLKCKKYSPENAENRRLWLLPGDPSDEGGTRDCGGLCHCWLGNPLRWWPHPWQVHPKHHHNKHDELKSQITLQAFAKSFGTSDGKS